MNLPSENSTFPKKIKGKHYTYGEVLDGPDGWKDCAKWYLLQKNGKTKSILSKEEEYYLKRLYYIRKYKNGTYSNVALVQSSFRIHYDAVEVLSKENINQVDDLGNNALIAAIKSYQNIQNIRDMEIKMDLLFHRKNIINFLINNNIDMIHKNNVGDSAYSLAKKDMKHFLFHSFISKSKQKYRKNKELIYNMIIDEVIKLSNLDLKDAMNRVNKEMENSSKSGIIYKINDSRINLLNKLKAMGYSWEDDNTNAWITKERLTIIIPYVNNERSDIGVFFNFTKNEKVKSIIKNSWLNNDVDRNWFKDLSGASENIRKLIDDSGYVKSITEEDNIDVFKVALKYLKQSGSESFYKTLRSME